MQISGSYIIPHTLFKPIMSVSVPSAEQSPVGSVFLFIYWIPEISLLFGFLLTSLSTSLQSLLSALTLSSKCTGTEEAMLESLFIPLPCSMEYLYSYASHQSKWLLKHCWIPHLHRGSICNHLRALHRPLYSFCFPLNSWGGTWFLIQLRTDKHRT